MRPIFYLMLFGAAFGATAQQTMLQSNLLSAATLTVEGGTVDNLAALTDGDDTTVATFTKTGETMSIICTFPYAVEVTGVNFVAGEDLDTAPTRVALAGRNADTDSWSTTARQILYSYTLPYTNGVGRTSSSKSFTQHKLELSKTKGDGSVVQIAELQFLGYDRDGREVLSGEDGTYRTSSGEIDYAGYGASVTVPKASYNNGVIGDNAWKAWLQYDFDTPTAITGYSLGGGSVSSKNNRPAVWELQASNDGESWVTLDMRSNAPDVNCDNYALEYNLGASGPKIDFANVANRILSMANTKFYRNYGGGKYWIAFWNKDESKHDLGYNYWWMAHTVDAYVDAFRRTGSRNYDTYARNILSGMYIAYDANRKDLWNSYYDDMEWMCLACIRASETLPTSTDMWFKEAKQLFEWIWEGWDETTGGILWNNGSQRGVVDSKNSCSNGPAMIAAALLYQKTGEEHYLEKAKKIFDFMYANNLFNDGFVKDAPKNESRGWTFTYNQGTWVGGLLELYRITKDKKYYDIAVDLMDKSIDSRWYSPRGIMCESGKGDGGLFKGIYVRYLTDWVLSGLLDENRTVRYASYLLENARSLYQAALVKPDMTIMANWQNRGEANLDEYCSSVVLSGLFLVEGVDRLRRAGILTDDYTVVNPNAGEAYNHYRLVASDNFGGSNVEFCSFALLGEQNADAGVDNIVVDNEAIAEDDNWYTIMGVRVDEPTAPGIYIHKGRKVVIR